MKMRPRQTMGVELPASGNGERHLTFSVVPHFTGKFFSSHSPMPVGPRHAGQSPARHGRLAPRSRGKRSVRERASKDREVLGTFSLPLARSATLTMRQTAFPRVARERLSWQGFLCLLHERTGAPFVG